PVVSGGGRVRARRTDDGRSAPPSSGREIRRYCGKLCPIMSGRLAQPGGVGAAAGRLGGVGAASVLLGGGRIARTSEPSLRHADVWPVCSTLGVGYPWQVQPLTFTGA